jgi:MFS family permease
LSFRRDLQYAKFSAYGFLKNLRFFEPFMVLFLLSKGVSYLEIGALYAIREIAINIVEVPSGALADLLGRRRTMVASFVSYLISFVLFWIGSGMLLFVPAMLLFAFGEAFRTGTHKAMILTYLRLNKLEEYKTEYYGHTRSWSQTGSAVSAAIAAAIVFGFRDYDVVFLFSTLPYALDLLLMLTYPKGLDGSSSVGAVTMRERVGEMARFLRFTANSRGARRAVVSSALYGGVYKGSKDFLQPMIVAMAVSLPVFTRLPADRQEAILVGIVYTLLFLLTSWSARRASSFAHLFAAEVNALNWALVIGLVFALSVGITAAIGMTIVPVVLFFTIYLVQNLRRPIGVSVVSDAVPEQVLATVLSVESQLQSVMAAGVAFVIGAVAQLFASNVGIGILATTGIATLLLPLVWIPRSVVRSRDQQ